ncbi:MAG: exosortase system-associated protein, TIGR04073 family [Akkermansiaceae bacterium]|nr:exosortase system-associated protein, TIGR04073 family [Akkermansiaceae bacterium]
MSDFPVAKPPNPISDYRQPMKKLLVLATAAIALTGMASADIQAPPGAQYTSTRKLGRAISNILYGFIEIPEQIVRKTDDYGRKAGFSYGAVDGTNRALRRLGYGFYELFTFTCPTYRGTFKPPYERCGTDNRIEMNVHDGLSEFPPELGFETYFDHSRTQRY